MYTGELAFQRFLHSQAGVFYWLLKALWEFRGAPFLGRQLAHTLKDKTKLKRGV